MLRRIKKYTILTKFGFCFALISLLPLTTLWSASFSFLKFRLSDKCQKQKSEETLVSICSLYKDQLTTNEELLERLSYSKDTKENVALKIFDLLNKEASSIEKLESLVETNFVDLPLLLIEIQKINSFDLQKNAKHYIAKILALLDVFSIVRDKFFENLQALMDPKTLDWAYLQKLASLITIGIQILTYRATITNFIFTHFKDENNFLSTQIMRTFLSNLDSIENDARYFMSTVDAHNKEVSKTTTRLDNLYLGLELKLELSALRLQVSDDEILKKLEEVSSKANNQSNLIKTKDFFTARYRLDEIWRILGEVEAEIEEFASEVYQLIDPSLQLVYIDRLIQLRSKYTHQHLGATKREIQLADAMEGVET